MTSQCEHSALEQLWSLSHQHVWSPSSLYELSSDDFGTSYYELLAKRNLKVLSSHLYERLILTISHSHLDKSIAVNKYYGKSRDGDINVYLNSDIVFTTYHTLAASMDAPQSMAYYVDWFRVVLDEGETCNIM